MAKFLIFLMLTIIQFIPQLIASPQDLKTPQLHDFRYFPYCMPLPNRNYVELAWRPTEEELKSLFCFRRSAIVVLFPLDLASSNLKGVDFTGVNLFGANLANADLSRANLSGVNLNSANLMGADMYYADLTEAKLISANLSAANVVGVDLPGALLRSANLSGVNLNGANLQGADLIDANLTGASLINTDFTGAYLVKANLTDANLIGAVLIDSKSMGINLTNANLTNSKFNGTNLHLAIVRNAVYDLIPDSQPPIDSIASAIGLSSLNYSRPRALFKLRSDLKGNGYYEEERQITYAIRRGRLWKSNDLVSRFGDIFQWCLFDFTTKWGLQPWRSLVLLVAIFIPLFSVLYFFVLFKANPDASGIWKLTPKVRFSPDSSDYSVQRIYFKKSASGISTDRPFYTAFHALYFSVLSACHLGWRDLNFGIWIARLQPNPFVLQASGWVRTVSGIQSLISIWLIAIFFLTQFGRPFE